MDNSLDNQYWLKGGAYWIGTRRGASEPVELPPYEDPYVTAIKQEAAAKETYASGLVAEMQRASDLADRQFQYEMDKEQNAVARSFQTLTTQKQQLTEALEQKQNLFPLVLVGAIVYFFVLKKGKAKWLAL